MRDGLALAGAFAAFAVFGPAYLSSIPLGFAIYAAAGFTGVVGAVVVAASLLTQSQRHKEAREAPRNLWRSGLGLVPIVLALIVVLAAAAAGVSAVALLVVLVAGEGVGLIGELLSTTAATLTAGTGIGLFASLLALLLAVVYSEARWSRVHARQARPARYPEGLASALLSPWTLAGLSEDFELLRTAISKSEIVQREGVSEFTSAARELAVAAGALREDLARIADVQQGTAAAQQMIISTIEKLTSVESRVIEAALGAVQAQPARVEQDLVEGRATAELRLGEALTMLGNQTEAIRHFDEAIHVLDKAASRSPTRAFAYLALGTAFLRIEALGEAHRALTVASELFHRAYESGSSTGRELQGR